MEEIDVYALWARIRDFHQGIATEIDKFIQANTKQALASTPSLATDFDIAKIEWAPARDSQKGEQTWYADGTVNKANADWKKLYTAITEAKKVKNSPWFWTKMPEGRGYLWIDQGGNGIYRRLKKA